jgi:hypothetical protein
MTRSLLIAALLVTSAPVSAAPPRLPQADQRQVHCVAMMAILANDQQRGAPGWEGLPDVSSRGRHFSDLVVARIMKDHGMGQDAVRALVVNDVKALQDLSAKGKISTDAAHREASSCIAVMDAVNPVIPEPSMLRCAALAAVARDDLKAEQGPSGPALGMAMLASVLESEARKEMRAQQKTEAEGDVLFGLERETIAATSPEDGEAVYRNGEALRQCMALVKPTKGEASPH